jgi:hypothetical protein
MSLIEKTEEMLRKQSYDFGKEEILNKFKDSNKMPLIAEIFGKELNEEFFIRYSSDESFYYKARFSENGLLVFDDNYGDWALDAGWLLALLNGRAKLVEDEKNETVLKKDDKRN